LAQALGNASFSEFSLWYDQNLLANTEGACFSGNAAPFKHETRAHDTWQAIEMTCQVKLGGMKL
jgi:hypothetical protein